MEIEKKFLINRLPDNLDKYDCKEIIQGYLSTNPVLRVRKSNDRYILTYKSRQGVEQKDNICIADEIEADLTKDSFEHLLSKCDGVVIKKKRYVIPLDEKEVGVKNLKAELDIFEGVFDGLVFAEVEFGDINDINEFIKPDWFGKDVSDDKRYRNSFLISIGGRKQFEEMFVYDK